MKKLIALFLLLVVFTGCSAPGPAAGKYYLNGDASSRYIEINNDGTLSLVGFGSKGMAFCENGGDIGPTQALGSGSLRGAGPPFAYTARRGSIDVPLSQSTGITLPWDTAAESITFYGDKYVKGK